MASPASGEQLPRLAVGAVVVWEGSLLMVRRANPPESGRWSLPGGRVEAGETLAQAVEREVAEETGIKVCCGDLVGWVERIGPGYHFVILDFQAEPDGYFGELPQPEAGSDASEATWVPLGQLDEWDLVSGLKQFLDEHGITHP